MTVFWKNLSLGSRVFVGSSLALAVAVPLALPLVAVRAQQKPRPTVALPDSVFAGTDRNARGVSSEPLSAELRALVNQVGDINVTRAFDPGDAAGRFGLAPGDLSRAGGDPQIRVALTVAGGFDAGQLPRFGANVELRDGNLIFVNTKVRSLPRLAKIAGVQKIEALPDASVAPPKTRDRVQRLAAAASGAKARGAADAAASPMNFDHQGLTGKGVVVAVVDTGVQWDHPDFINPDGTTRLLALYDPFDDSFDKSGGKIGSKPPLTSDKKPLGTLYTREQINAALKKKGEVNSTDQAGHGTACLGTAAGNGRATGNGVAEGTYKGVAPEADLIAINVSAKAADGSRGGRGISAHVGVVAARWAIGYAKGLGKPCVVSMSFGNQFNAHDGSEGDEKLIDSMVGPGIVGAAVCASAGNDGEYSFHAAGKFGPRRDGQQDIGADPAILQVEKTTRITVYFDHNDHWGFAVEGLAGYLLDPTDNGVKSAAILFLPDYAKPGNMTVKLLKQGTKSTPATVQEYIQTYSPQADLPMSPGAAMDRLEFTLPAGRYMLYGLASDDKVTSGRYDVYVPSVSSASFTVGAVKERLTGSPGNAKNAITVGAHDAISAWDALDNKRSVYNLTPGEVSPFSSPGSVRGGFAKPTITAPGRYVISSAAKDSAMARDAGKAETTRDGFHLAWKGTSASTPYTAGVVALMLQKNPKLDAAQIAEILRKSTFPADDITGPLPNASYGHGRLDPVAALKNTPAAGLKALELPL